MSELDLEAFAAELERQGLGKKLNTLYDIRSELHDMYKDFREQFMDPSYEEIFNMVTKETHIPAIEHNIPTIEHYIPAIEHNIPTIEHYIPPIEHYIPAIEHYIPAIISLQLYPCNRT